MNIPIENIYYMLCYAWDKLDERDIINIDKIDKIPLIDLFAKIIINGTYHLLKRGLYRNYSDFSDDLKGIRGKIDFNSSIKKNLIKQTKLSCNFEELSHKIIHNQIIKATIYNLLLNFEIEDKFRKDMFYLFHQLREIDIIILNHNCFRKIQFHSNNYFYDFLIRVCELIYDNYLPAEKIGKFKFKDFNIDKKMPTIFEEFVRNFYKIELPQVNIIANIKSEKIDWYAKQIGSSNLNFLPEMKTDISIENENWKMIIDTKYYTQTYQCYYEKETIRNSHINQLYAYLKNIEKKGGVNSNCKGILLYPQVNEKVYLNYIIDGHEISIITINLNQNWKKIHEDLINLIKDNINLHQSPPRTPL